MSPFTNALERETDHEWQQRVDTGPSHRRGFSVCDNAGEPVAR